MASVVLLVLTGLLLFVGLLSAWANTTVYDSATFSERTVDMLNDPAVRRELAKRLTEQLVLSGNQQAGRASTSPTPSRSSPAPCSCRAT
jgi:hypothetical protein